MNTLLLRLDGPLQSWGVQSRFGVRDTGREPSKSGVIGLLCAALGRARTASLEDLTSLPMGVRVDREGRLEMDFHTAQQVYRAGGGIKDTEVSRRYFLAGAIFLVGFESDDQAFLETLSGALRNPHWPLYLGRRAFVPGDPVWLPDGLRIGESLEAALRSYPWLGRDLKQHARLQRVRVVLEDEEGESVRPDLPLSFSPRQFAARRVRVAYFDPPPAPKEVEICTSPE